MQYPTKNLYDDEMDWKEFSTLLAGLSQDTPLGQIVSIRAQEQPDALKNYTKEQHQIRNEWRETMRKKMQEEMSEEEKIEQITHLQMILQSAF